MVNVWNEEEAITEISASDDWYSIRCGSTGFGLKKSYGVVPKVGDKVSLATINFSLIRGMKINGEIVFFTTDEQLEQKRVEEVKKKELEAVEFNKLPLASIEHLPEPVQAWITRIRSKRINNEFDFGKYDRFVGEEATKIYEAYNFEGGVDGLKDFSKLSWEEQKKRVPTLSDDHSGNTFGVAMQMAHLLLTKPALVKFMHGALVHLVGCKGYNCHPLTEDEKFECERAGL